jgi:predicted signal transduction protein with EAL and GGDEF domain
VAARFADHSFAVLARGHDHTQTQALAERIRATFETQILELGSQSVSMTVSIGGVQIGEKIASVPQILARASAGLQSAQGVGGNRIEVYDPAARDRAEEERIQAWVQRIQDALREDQFVLNFQPMISLTGDPTENYEVLLAHEGAERRGRLARPVHDHRRGAWLLVELDRWVISRTIALLGERRKAGKDTTLYVKVAPASLVEGDLHNVIGAQLKAHAVSGANLVLQLSESKIYTHLRPLQRSRRSSPASAAGSAWSSSARASIPSSCCSTSTRRSSRSTAASSWTWPGIPRTRRRCASSSRRRASSTSRPSPSSSRTPRR